MPYFTEFGEIVPIWSIIGIVYINYVYINKMICYNSNCKIIICEILGIL